MPYVIFITPAAVEDISIATEYYNALSTDLGFRFDLLANYFNLIAAVPTSSSVRYKNVRCKPMKRFPYLITFVIDDTTQSINILRVFNTYQEPLGQPNT
jgi:toxin ParE1/3/4